MNDNTFDIYRPIMLECIGKYISSDRENFKKYIKDNTSSFRLVFSTMYNLHYSTTEFLHIDKLYLFFTYKDTTNHIIKIKFGEYFLLNIDFYSCEMNFYQIQYIGSPCDTSEEVCKLSDDVHEITHSIMKELNYKYKENI